MKKYVFVSVLLAILGCAVQQTEISKLYRYDFSLLKPPSASGGLAFEEENFFLSFAPTHENINLLFTNRSSRFIKINWDEAAYVDKDGVSHRLITKGVKYEDKDRPQTPTMVAPKSRVSESVLPADNVYQKYLRWQARPMFPELTDITVIDQWDRTTFRLLLSLEIDGQRRPYEFEFKVRIR